MNVEAPRPRGLFGRFVNSRQVRLLSQRRYGLYMLGNGVSSIGSWMQRIAMLWLVWEMTESGFWLGMLAIADMLPILVIGPFAGVAADRWDRLKQTRLCQIVHVVIAALFGILLILDLLSLPALMILAIANGSMIAVNQPARLALVQSLVRREDVGTAVALSSVNVNLARLTGPALAGAMIVYLDVEWLFLTNAALTLIFLVILHFTHIDPLPPRQRGKSVMAEVVSGFVFAFNDKGIRLLLTLLLLGGAGVRAVQDLFPAVAQNNFDSTATGLAFLTSSMAIGAVVSGLTFGVHMPLAILARKVAVSWGFAALALSLLVFSPHAAVDTALAMVVGFFVTRGVVGTQTFVQLRAPEAMRGRALSVHGLISRGSPAIGALATGWAFDRIGLTIPMLLATGIVIATALICIPAIGALGPLSAGDE